MNATEEQILIKSINEALKKPSTSAAFHLFGLSKHYFEKAQIRYLPQKGDAVYPIDVEKINQQLMSYHRYRNTLEQFSPISAETSMAELDSIVDNIKKEPIIRFDPAKYDIQDLNRQIQAYAKYKGEKIDEIPDDIDPQLLSGKINNINAEEPIDIPTLAKLNKQIAGFCLYKKQSGDKTRSSNLFKTDKLGYRPKQITQRINQENKQHYDLFTDFYIFTTKHLLEALEKSLAQGNTQEQAQKIDELSNISKILMQMGDYNSSTIIMNAICQKLGEKTLNRDELNSLISEQTKSLVNEYNEMARRLTRDPQFYVEKKAAIPRVEIAINTTEKASGRIGLIGGTNDTITALKTIKKKMNNDSTVELDTLDEYSKLTQNYRALLTKENVDRMIIEAQQEYDEIMRSGGMAVIVSHRKMIDGLSKSTDFDYLKEILIKPVEDYLSHFDEKGPGGAGLFSRLSPVTPKKKQAAIALIEKISGATDVENLVSILNGLETPKQLSTGSKKPQLIVIRDGALQMLQEYKQSILEPRVDITQLKSNITSEFRRSISAARELPKKESESPTPTPTRHSSPI